MNKKAQEIKAAVLKIAKSQDAHVVISVDEYERHTVQIELPAQYDWDNGYHTGFVQQTQDTNESDEDFWTDLEFFIDHELVLANKGEK